MTWTKHLVLGLLVCPVALAARITWSLVSYFVDLGEFVLTSFDD